VDKRSLVLVGASGTRIDGAGRVWTSRSVPGGDAETVPGSVRHGA
jgi:hypothetical protein